ncbi:type II toxin-antitoxin system VapC family toxin [Nitrosomonas communis]|uniref:type II toxin-antitoxin system VapC family toxin n=1 Tax=Nitrosomonas communis TaxID=44574 RepID=UPI0026EEF1DB|nr:type II toxin-antitoxin system VapC family toxin [Nitrosomonas communis]MCO6428788.1 type II toxin-antitoxin system VapC family toxin [Nitrosomonas communis]
MIAFDTNMLVRLVVNDHPAQAEIVESLLRTRHAWISRTVLLETEWVLRCVYKFSREQIHEFLQLLLQTENTEVENSLAVSRALSWYQCGADFADALHLAVCGSTVVMHTFNREFCKAAREAGITPEVHVWEA